MKVFLYLERLKSYKRKSFVSIVRLAKPFGLSTNFTKFSNEISSKQNIFYIDLVTMGYVSKDVTNKTFCGSINIKCSYKSQSRRRFVSNIRYFWQTNCCRTYLCSTETYILVGPFENEKHANNVALYMKSSFLDLWFSLTKILKMYLKEYIH